MNTDSFHVVSLSGGKDSTAMLLLMLERGFPIDAVLNADTDMEFPEMYEHLRRLDEHLFRERGLHITTLKSSRSFEYLMFDEPKQRPSCIANRQSLGVPCKGNGWPGIRVRWCTGQLKTHLIGREINRMKQGREVILCRSRLWPSRLCKPSAPRPRRRQRRGWFPWDKQRTCS